MIEEMTLQEAKREQQRSQNTYSKSSNSSSFDDLTRCLLCWVHILHEISHSYYRQNKDICSTVQYQGFFFCFVANGCDKRQLNNFRVAIAWTTMQGKALNHSLLINA